MRSDIVFLGDSLTSGENNNNKSFVEYLNVDAINFGISGTCIGDYSLYPVGKSNLIDILQQNAEPIQRSKCIFLEYGCNDVSSIVVKNTTLQKVKIELIKCLDYIHQLNPTVEIYFITLGKCNIKTFAQAQTNYLKNDYLHFSNISYHKWIRTYKKFNKFINQICSNVVCLTDTELCEDELDTDKLHPNAVGYKRISCNLMLHINI